MALPSIHSLFGVRKATHRKSSRSNRLQTIRSLLVEPLEERRLLSASTVVGRDLFYASSSRYDQPGGTYPQDQLAYSDDNAIATDKSAFLPGMENATFANVSSYTLGINGIMVDLLGDGAHSSITSSDFIFKAGNTNTVDSTWTTPASPTVSVRLGMTGAANGIGTTSGSDRVELIWASGAVTQKWLEVTVLADSNTGLAANDVFFFGSAPGKTGDAGVSNITPNSTMFKVGAGDVTGVQSHVAPSGTNQPVTNVYDFNRDGAVSTIDITFDQTHTGNNNSALRTFYDELHLGSVYLTTTQIYTPEDTIPRFVPAWASTKSLPIDKAIVPTGNWSDASTWSLGVPAVNQLVQIPAGSTVTFDASSTPDIQALEIEGTLTYATDRNTELKVGTVEVLPNGTLQIGTAANPVRSGTTAKLTIAAPKSFINSQTQQTQALDTTGIDPNQYGTGLIAFGTVSIHGSPIGTLTTYDPANATPGAQTWIRLAAEPLAGATTLTLPASTDTTGWNPGDQLVLPDTRQSKSTWLGIDGHTSPAGEDFNPQWEVVTILTPADGSSPLSSDGQGHTIVQLQSPVQFNHFGARDLNGNLTHVDTAATASTTAYADSFLPAAPGDVLLPHVALLTRNVIVASENPDGIRGHTFYSGRANVDIEYATFQDLGRTASMDPQGNALSIGDTFTDKSGNQETNVKGRYAVHFHHMLGPENPNQVSGRTQFTFIGNTVQGSKKWAVAVHDTDYGLLQDNVIFDAQGAGFVTEDGSEIGNQFIDDITIAIRGVSTSNGYVDGNPGQAAFASGDYGNGGVGFWFRRSGGDVKGNVAADSSYAGLVITSYYLDSALEPNFPGADTHAGQGTQQAINPAGSFVNNEFYGMSDFGFWVTYIESDNDYPGTNHVFTFDHLRIWNAATISFGYLYHTDQVTFDHLLMLGDQTAENLDNYGPSGLTMAVYESFNTKITNSRIEGARDGIVAPPADASQFGQAPIPTVIENTILKNQINVVVSPGLDFVSVGIGNFLTLTGDTLTETLPLAYTSQGGTLIHNGPPSPTYNIMMSLSAGGAVENLTQYSAVTVDNTTFNHVYLDGNNNVQTVPTDVTDPIGVYYKEQAAGATMADTSAGYYWGGNRAQIGAPLGSTISNQTAWNTYGFATAGSVAPGDAVDGANYGIFGLTSSTTFNPLALPARVVLATPWNGATFFDQQPASSVVVMARYNVQGSLFQSSTNDYAQVGFTLDKFDGSQWTTLYKYTPENAAAQGRLLGPAYDTGSPTIVPGHYRLHAYMTDRASQQEIANTEGPMAEFDVQSLPDPSTISSSISLAGIPETKTSLATIPGLHAWQGFPPYDPNAGVAVSELMAQAGVGLANYSARGMVITSAPNTYGDWYYLNNVSQWAKFDTNQTLSTTNGLALPPWTRLQFVVNSNPRPSGYPTPQLQFRIWDDSDHTKEFNYGFDTTGSLQSQLIGGTITVTQPLLATLSINSVTQTQGTTFVFAVSLSSASAQPVTVAFTTIDGSATTAEGDYVATSGTLTFAASQTTAYITMTVNSAAVEADETFSVVLSNPLLNGQISGVVLDTNWTGIGTISG